MKPKLSLIALLFFAPLVLAQCPYLDVSLVQTAQAQTGVNAVYPITLTNTGINSQLVSLSASCDYPLECSFAQSPYTTLAPTQSALFQLEAKSALAGSFQIPLSISAGTNENCDSKALSLAVSQAPVQESDPFELFFTPTSNQSGRPGDELAYGIRITNNRNTKIYVRLASEGFFSGATRFSASDVEVEGGQEKTVSIKISIPPGTPSNRYAQAFTARVTNNDGAQFFYSFPTQIFVYSEKLQLVLQNEPLKCAIAPHNEETKIRLKVRNDGEIEGPFDVELNAGAQASQALSVTPEILEVKQGDSQEILISINPKPSTILDVYGYEFVLSYNGIPVFLRDYCFEVFAKTGFAIKTQQEYSVSKGQVGVLLPFEIFNNGSITQNFAIEISPPRELLVKPEPASFSLAAGERKQANLVVTPSRNMKNGKIKLPVVVRTSSIAKAYSFNLTILAAGQSSGDGLEVGQESLRAFAGLETKVFLTVKNGFGKLLRNAHVSFEGIPESWIAAQQIDLPANSVQGILLTFNIPSSEKQDAKTITARIDAGGESVEKQMVLYVEKPFARLEMQMKQSSLREENGKRTLFITLIVSNTGEKPLTGVKAMLPTGYVLATQQPLNLQPGQSAEVTVSIDNPPSENIPIWLESQEGTSTEPQTVKITAKKQEVSWSWVAVAIIAFLAIIFLSFKRRQEQYS